MRLQDQYVSDWDSENTVEKPTLSAFQHVFQNWNPTHFDRVNDVLLDYDRWDLFI